MRRKMKRQQNKIMNMNRFIYAIFALAFLASASCSVEEVPVQKPEKQEEGLAKPLTGELMVKFTPEVAAVIEQNALKRSAPMTRTAIPTVDEILNLIGGYELERVFPLNRKTEAATRESGLHQWYVVRFSDELSPEEVAESLSVLGEVQKVSYNRSIKRAYRTEAKAFPVNALSKAGGATGSYPFNDDLLPYQWNIINRGDLFPGVGDTPNKAVLGADVQVEEAWNECTGDPSVIVAILDEGVFLEHPDLKASIWENEDEIYRSREDNDGNGYIGDRHGYNFVKNTGIISWDDTYDTGHASHVAGVIAAQNNNGVGLSSIAGGTPEHPGVKIMSCQIFSGNIQSDSYSSIRAIKYAADNGATVLQCSWGYVSGEANIYDWGAQGFKDQEEWEYACPLEKEVLDYFVHRAGSASSPVKGGIAVFASGNENAAMAGFPGAADICVSVAATAADFTPAVYTNYGPGTNISAPGGDQNYYFEYVDEVVAGSSLKVGELGCILSTLPYHVSKSGYGYMEGTSMACPHVSGVVALGLSYAAQLHKQFTVEEFKQLLFSTATPFEDYITGTKHYYRYVADVGLNHAMQMPLSGYRGKMGCGQVNAAKLLEAIAKDGNGSPMRFPNLYVALGGHLLVNPAAYMDGTAFSINIADKSIAGAEVEGGRIKVNGLKTGMTKATLVGGPAPQEFVITVRRNADGNSWM